MRKLTFFIVALMAFGYVLSACSQNKKENQEMKDVTSNKTLVAYFSASGVTKGAAGQLAEIIGADLYEIEPEQPYTDADLDWRDKQSRSTLEMQDSTSRPAIKGTVENIAQYETVYIGFPIWWYTAPTIINTFIEKNDLKGKTLVPFATSGGSTIDKACADLKRTYPELKWKEGKLLNHIDKAEILEWSK